MEMNRSSCRVSCWAYRTELKVLIRILESLSYSDRFNVDCWFLGQWWSLLSFSQRREYWRWKLAISLLEIGSVIRDHAWWQFLSFNSRFSQTLHMLIDEYFRNTLWLLQQFSEIKIIKTSMMKVVRKWH